MVSPEIGEQHEVGQDQGGYRCLYGYRWIRVDTKGLQCKVNGQGRVNSADPDHSNPEQSQERLIFKTSLWLDSGI